MWHEAKDRTAGVTDPRNSPRRAVGIVRIVRGRNAGCVRVAQRHLPVRLDLVEERLLGDELAFAVAHRKRERRREATGKDAGARSLRKQADPATFVMPARVAG